MVFLDIIFYNILIFLNFITEYKIPSSIVISNISIPMMEFIKISDKFYLSFN